MGLDGFVLGSRGVVLALHVMGFENVVLGFGVGQVGFVGCWVVGRVWGLSELFWVMGDWNLGLQGGTWV